MDDGKWHHVKVRRQGNHATLILDQGRHRAWNKSPGKMRILNLDENAIYFGAKVVRSKTRRDIGKRGKKKSFNRQDSFLFLFLVSGGTLK